MDIGVDGNQVELALWDTIKQEEYKCLNLAAKLP